jgi:hypothetical protein
MLHASSARQQRSAASSRRDIGYRPKLGDKTSTNKARDTIEQLVGLTTIPLLQARFADIIWLLCKNYKMAEQAATNYLAAFKAVDDADIGPMNSIVLSAERLSRGCWVPTSRYLLNMSPS